MNEPLYVYAIAAVNAQLPAGVGGLLDAPLKSFACRDLTAVTSALKGAIVDTSAEHVLRHEAVVEAVRAVTPALPVRFGTILSDAASLERAMSRRHDTLAADLRRLGDKWEYGLTVLWITEDEGNDLHAGGVEHLGIPTRLTGPGSVYLRTREQVLRREDTRRTRTEALAAELERILGRFALEQRQKPPAGERLMLRTAYLVGPGDDEAFKAAFEEARRTHGGLRFLLSGPWPPYSFVSRDDIGSLLAEV